MSDIPRRDPLINQAIEILERHWRRSKFDYAIAFNTLGSVERQFIKQELKKCILSPRYYLENYHTIQTEDEGFKTLYPFWDSQEIFYSEIMQMVLAGKPVKCCVLKSRQLGLSTISEGLIFHRTIFKRGVNALIVAQDPGQSAYLFDMFLRAYDNLPWWMQPEKLFRSKGKYLIFDTDKPDREGLHSNIFVEAANKLSGVSVGKTIRAGHLSELSAWDDPTTLTEQIFPTMNAKDELAIMESTARGRSGAGKFWYTFWNNCVNKWGDGLWEWKPIFIEWFRCSVSTIDKKASIGKYSRSIDGESFVPTANELAFRAKVQKDTPDHFTIPDEMLKWRRYKIDETIAATGSAYGFQQEYCLVGSTRVSTNAGMLKLSESIKGLRSHGNDIIGWYRQGVKPVLRVTTGLGYEITGTAEHVFPTAIGEVELSNLLLHKVVLSPPEFSQSPATLEWEGPCHAKCSIPMDEDFARFIGYFQGDGCYASGGVSIVCDAKDGDVVADVSRLMGKLFGGHAKPQPVGSKKGGVEIRVGCVEFKQVMEALGIYRTNGMPHRVVAVPEVMWKCPKPVVKEFLRGLFEADGFNGYKANRVCLFSKHVQFLKDVQLLLLGFGITCKLRSRPSVNGKGYKYVANTLELRSVEARLFNKEIGFISKRKTERAMDLEFSVGRPQMPIEMVDEVVSVRSAGEEEVYDITIHHPDHTFSANGILTHNCANHIEAFKSSGTCAFPRELLHKILETDCCDPDWVGEIEYHHEAQTKFKLFLTDVREKRKRESGWAIPSTDFTGGRLRIWEKPMPGEAYYIGADVAHGIEGRDYSCACVIRIGRGGAPDEQVAEWHGWISPTPFGDTLAALGYYYNTCEISSEINDCGQKTYMQLFRIMGYPQLFRWKHYDRVKNFYSDLMAWQTNSKTRPLLITNMRERLMDGVIKLHSYDLLDEMDTFAADDDGGRFEGQDNNDDACFASMICLWCAHDSDYGKQAEMSAPVGSSGYFVMDGRGRVVEQCHKQNDDTKMWEPLTREEAMSHLAKNPSWSVRRQMARKDKANTEFSPVHDRAGVRATMHYEMGIPAEHISGSNLIDAQAEDPTGDWRVW